MRIYFDTSILVAALKTEHIHHPASYAAVDSVVHGDQEGLLSAHGLIELYSVLTRTPFTTPLYPDQVLTLIEQSILPFFQVIEVNTQSHLAAISLCAKAGWKGGRIHNAVHIQAAAQARCDLIYTYNLTDFHALAPAQASQIQNPPTP
jgi:predicted nucleic acid-binding protein